MNTNSIDVNNDDNNDDKHVDRYNFSVDITNVGSTSSYNNIWLHFLA